jgi:hypothetical protein
MRSGSSRNSRLTAATTVAVVASGIASTRKNRLCRSTRVPSGCARSGRPAGHPPSARARFGRAPRPAGDADHVRDPVPARCQTHPPLRSPAHPLGAQLGAQLPPQHPFGLHEQRCVDGLVRNPHRRLVGIRVFEAAADLLRRPAQGELVLDNPAQHRPVSQLAGAVASSETQPAGRPAPPGSRLGRCCAPPHATRWTPPGSARRQSQ